MAKIDGTILRDVPSSCAKLGEDNARALLEEWKNARDNGHQLEREGLELVLGETQNGAKMEALWLAATYASEVLLEKDIALLNAKLANAENDERTAAMLPLNQIAKNRRELVTQEIVDAVVAILASEKTQAQSTIVGRCLEFLKEIKRTEKAELLLGKPMDGIITAAERFKENTIAITLIGIIGALASKTTEEKKAEVKARLERIGLDTRALEAVRSAAVRTINAFTVSRSGPQSRDFARPTAPTSSALVKATART